MKLGQLKAAVPEYLRLRALLLSPDFRQVTRDEMHWVNGVGMLFLDLVPETVALLDALSQESRCDERGGDFPWAEPYNAVMAKLEARP